MGWMAIASAAISAVGALNKADAESEQYEANAKASEYNAAVNRQRAETKRQFAAVRAGQIGATTNLSEEQQRVSSRMTAGTRQAAIAQSGTGDDGSNADIDRQAQVFAEMDALNIRYSGVLQQHDVIAQAEMDAYDLESGARLDDYGASNARYSADSAESAGFLGAAGALLGGYGKYLGNMSPGSGGGLAPSLNMG
jgi:hypothetical protein